MNGDLISREALTDKSEILYQHTESGKIIPWSAVRVCAINNAPAVDAVPVVRCKDCKNFMEYSDDYKDEVEGAAGDCWIRVVHTVCEPQFCAVRADDFCSYGAKMDKEDTSADSRNP